MTTLKKTPLPTARPAAVIPLLLFLAGVVVTVDGSPEFQALIPNGANVVGLDGQAWPAVGHGAPSGGTAATINPFGAAFKAAGLVWTADLCRQDSDGDGRTNGEELGDPDCVWQPGAAPNRTAHISHPGLFNDFAAADHGSSSNETVGAPQAGTPPQQYSLPAWLVAHIACMMLSWGFFLPIGALMAISFRGTLKGTGGGGGAGGTQLWFKLHVSIQVLGLVLTIVGFAIAFAQIGTPVVGSHQIMGTVVFALALAQGLMGHLRPHKPSSPGERPTALRTVWEYCHKGFGRIVIVLAWANTFLGVKLVKSDYSGLPAGSTDTIYMGMNAILGLQAGLCLVLTCVALFYPRCCADGGDDPTSERNESGKGVGGRSTELTTTAGPHDLEEQPAH